MSAQGTGNSRQAQAAFVISLDFELHWGVRDRQSPFSSYRNNLLGARQAIPKLLDLFEEFQISATWATVGFLFAHSKRELRDYFPRVRPDYENKALDPFMEPLGEDERDDPLHYAPSLISMIQERPRQEIGTHTFSHYYCLEPGQTQESFAADLESAVALARKRGIEVRSLVLPRNQVNQSYLGLLAKHGITNYRGPEKGWMHSPRPRMRNNAVSRGARLFDQYVPLSGSRTVSWNEVAESAGLYNVRGSMFLRPWSPKLQIYDAWRQRRIRECLERAARSGGIFHLWWHPHNFGVNTDRNLSFLRSIFQDFRKLREQYGMRSLSMSGVADEISFRRGCSKVEQSPVFLAASGA